MIFTKNFLFGLTSVILSLQSILNIVNTETYFNIVFYSATFLRLTSFMAWLLETFGSKHAEETAFSDWTVS